MACDFAIKFLNSDTYIVWILMTLPNLHQPEMKFRLTHSALWIDPVLFRDQMNFLNWQKLTLTIMSSNFLLDMEKVVIPKTGEKLYFIQSYTSLSAIHIWKNLKRERNNPWFNILLHIQSIKDSSPWITDYWLSHGFMTSYKSRIINSLTRIINSLTNWQILTEKNW